MPSALYNTKLHNLNVKCLFYLKKSEIKKKMIVKFSCDIWGAYRYILPNV